MRLLLSNLLMIALLAPVGASSTRMPIGRPSVWPIPREDKQTDAERKIEDRDRKANGIIVGEPKVYDDALLQKMLSDAEARLRTIQVIEAGKINERQGAVSGADLRTSGFALNAQGPALPGVVTTAKGPTASTSDTIKKTVKDTIPGDDEGPTETTLDTTRLAQTGAGSTDVATTRAGASVPTVTAPAATAQLPTSFTVSSSDILNEQMQLTFEIANLRLLLAGSLSDHFVKPNVSDLGNIVKLKTSLGFPIAIVPDKRHKDAVAIVEVEVKSKESLVAKRLKTGELEPQRPAVTALLPREKTYNVASLTDKSTSIQAGVVTQVIGISGSWLRSHKTYYLVQDQDTVALSFQPEETSKVGFMWQFRPVLGREYVKAGLKQTFVQLAFPALPDARSGQIGEISVRTYWRKYDRKHGVVKEILANSLVENVFPPFDIPRYTLEQDLGLDSQGIEDLGSGQLRVRLVGRFLPGTFVRVGNALADMSLDYSGLVFVASASAMAANKVTLVAHDGSEVPLVIRHLAPVQTRSASGQETQQIREMLKPEIDTIKVTTIDSATSLVTATLKNNAHFEKLPSLLLVIGGRAFGYSDAPIQQNAKDGTLAAVVPTAFLLASPEVVVKWLFAPEGMEARKTLPTFDGFSQTERFVILEQGKESVRFLLQGHRLTDVKVVVPNGLTPASFGDPASDSSLVTLTLNNAQLKANKLVVLQRPGERPFLVVLPPVEVKEVKPVVPKAIERVTVNANEVVIEGEGLNEVEKVLFRKKSVKFSASSDGRTLVLKNLKAVGLSKSSMTQSVELVYKAATTTVKLELTDRKVETTSK